MKKTKLIANIAFALLYFFFATCFFMCADEISEPEFMVFFMSHFYLIGALTFRKPERSKSWFCRTFVLYIGIFNTIALLPISDGWVLVPFWLIGYIHGMNISYDETIGRDDGEVSEGEQVKRMCYLWMACCFLVTLFAF